MNNFFCNHKTQKSDPEHTFSEIDINYRRDYSKGKSFKVSIWNEIDTYNNDDFIQDFVIYNQSLWARIDSTPSINEVPTEGPWTKIMDGVSDVQFKEEGNKIFWKYEDESEWKDLFELDVVSESEIKNMLKDIATDVDSNFYDKTLSETSVNAVQNKVITQALNKKADKTELSKKQDVIPDLSEIRNKAKSALQFVPSEYITEDELDSKGYLTEHQDISGKQDKIADLAQIRANAQKGATALQSVPEKYATKTDVSNEVAKIVNSAPKAFDTLKEIADWIEEDAEPAIVLANKVEQKADKTDVAEALAKKADNPVVISIEKLGNPVYSDKDGSGWSVQQVENAFGMTFASFYEDVKKRGVVFGDNSPSLYAFQSMEQDGQLTYCFNVSTADSKTKIEYWLSFFETPETLDDIEVAIVLASMVVDLSYDDTETKAELARLEGEKAEKPFIFSAEKLGDPTYQKDEDGQGVFAYTKEQVEAAFGMSTAEIYEELKTRDAILDLGIKALPCIRYDTAMDGLIVFYYYWPTFGQGSAEYSLSFYVEPAKIAEGVEANLVINATSVDNTEIRNELTELSAEVSGLSERIENLPSAESSVFEAIYGTTTFAEIVEARNKGKEVLCKYNDRIARIVQVMDNVLIYFEVTIGSDSQRLVCYPSNRWDSLYINNSHKLENLADNNVKITIAGQTAEVATPQYVENAIQQSGTPSGDPMHYMYEAVGAEWNGTGADIEKQGVYGDTITHKAGYWYLNELGDITNEEMRAIYVESNPMVRRLNLEDAFTGGTIRTNIAIWDANKSTSYGSIAHTSSELRGMCQDAQIEIFAFIIGPINKTIQKHMVFSASSLSSAFRQARKLSKIIGCLNCANPTDYKCFEDASMLKEVRLTKLKNSFSFADSPLLSKNSVLFAIQNAEATSAITITLHADAYARLAEDADIVAALAEKEFVSLASA